MRFTENDVYHIYNRGNNRGQLFFTEANYRFFLDKLRTQIAPVAHVLSWCLMPNHFHLLVEATAESCRELPSFGGRPMQVLASNIGKLLSSYSQAINKQNGTTGALFQPKTKAKSITDALPEAGYPGSIDRYLIRVVHYIHQNPWKAGLVARMEDWTYSSFRAYIGEAGDGLCRPELFFQRSGCPPASFYEDSYRILNGFR